MRDGNGKAAICAAAIGPAAGQRTALVDGDVEHVHCSFSRGGELIIQQLHCHTEEE